MNSKDIQHDISISSRCLADGDTTGALNILGKTLYKPLSFQQLSIVDKLLSKVKEPPKAWEVIRIAIIGDCTTSPLVTAARCSLLMEGFFPILYEAPYNTLTQEILSPTSRLYSFGPSIILLAPDARRHEVTIPFGANEFELQQAISSHISKWANLWSLINERLSASVLQHVYELPVEDFTGLSEKNSKFGMRTYLSALNENLINSAPGFVRWLDVDRLAERVGRLNWRDARLDSIADFAFNPSYTIHYLRILGRSLRLATGKQKKALILDLDNTLWGGVIGDDGLEGIHLGPNSLEGKAYMAFCAYVLELGKRGVILGICSKNNMEVASKVFQEHPHMPLALSDFSAIRCNWSDKAHNLVEIAEELNIDLSSLVFVDDNPAECERIRQELPNVVTIKLGDDPSSFIRMLDHLSLFGSDKFSIEDFTRTKSYQARTISDKLRRSSPDLSSYLTSLKMKGAISRVSNDHLPRLAQLEAKTNQFNLSTRRLNQQSLQMMSVSPDCILLAVSMVDRFANHGLVSYLAASCSHNVLLITDWVMSCRVFSRTLEEFTFIYLLEEAKMREIRHIRLFFKPTDKNLVMLDSFDRLGLRCNGNHPSGPWSYEIGLDSLPKTFITPLKSSINSARF